jgi:predicted amidohydrolase YtcJ
MTMVLRPVRSQSLYEYQAVTNKLIYMQGVFVDNAMGLVPIPPWTLEETNAKFERAMKDALAVGLTSIHDAATEPLAIKFFKQKAEEGSLPVIIIHPCSCLPVCY